jgi:two-component system aerobic respiration control sensor histidine kinase ArcB
VDDEPDMTDMLKMALEHAGFTVDTFNDPVLALNSFKPNMYGLVILDVMMQKMDGFELYNQLKKVDPGIKVCFLTASSEMYREKLVKEKHCELNKDLFMNMPLPISKIVEEINRRINLRFRSIFKCN